MGLVDRYSCRCGYATEVYDGGGVVVANAICVCEDCAELVGVAVRRAVTSGAPKAAVADPHCPRCSGTHLRPAERAGLRRRVRCPRCGGATDRESLGVWN